MSYKYIGLVRVEVMLVERTSLIGKAIAKFVARNDHVTHAYTIIDPRNK